jgi:hypothetical protein
MVTAAITPLMPGAGPPPTRIPNLPLLMCIYWLLVKSETAECLKFGKNSIPFLVMTVTGGTGQVT